MKTLLAQVGFAVSSLMLAGALLAAPAPVDRPPKLIWSPVLEYPPRALHEAVYRGEVHVVMIVDEQGRIADHVVTRYTHTAFRDHIPAVLKASRFAPATIRGEPAAVRLEARFAYEAKGMVVSLTAMDELHARFVERDTRKLASALSGPGELDRPLTPRRTVAPRATSAESSLEAPTQVTLDFFVDQSGKVRMPVVTRGENASLASSAVDALLQWEFDPPRRRGEPVLVEVRQSFNFSANK